MSEEKLKWPDDYPDVLPPEKFTLWPFQNKNHPDGSKAWSGGQWGKFGSVKMDHSVDVIRTDIHESALAAKDKRIAELAAVLQSIRDNHKGEDREITFHSDYLLNRVCNTLGSEDKTDE